MSRGKWTLMQWCSERFKFLPRELTSKLPPLSARKRIPSIDKILKTDPDTKALEFLDILNNSPLNGSKALQEWAPNLDVDTLEEYAHVLLSHTSKSTNGETEVIPGNVSAILQKYGLVDRLLHPEQYGVINPKIGHSNIDEQRESSPLKLLQYNSFFQDGSVLQNRLDSTPNIYPEVQLLQTEWKKQLHLERKNLNLPDSKLQVIHTALSWEKQCDIVATFLGEFVTNNIHSTFPQSVTGLCLKLGRALEHEILAATAEKNNVIMFHPQSQFVWGLLNGTPWNLKQHITLGAAWLEIAVKVCKSRLVRNKEIVMRPAFWKTWYVNKTQRRGVLVVNGFLLKQLKEDVASKGLLHITSRHLPLLHEPRPWTSTSENISPSPKPGMSLIASPSTEGIATLKQSLINGNSLPHIRGLNRLQSQRWQVNERILRVLDPGFVEDEDNGEQTRTAVAIANALNGRPFYLPMYMDFRGRCYTSSKVPLSFMGNDRVRSLFNFAESKPLGENGLKWLCVHLANLAGHCKSKTFEERLQWVESNRQDIEKSAADPLQHRWWLDHADKSFQTLAACMELVEVWKSDDPSNFRSALPIQLDGTSNGLQHLVALARDEKNAPLVNVKPLISETSGESAQICGDIYSAIAGRVSREYALKDSPNDAMSTPAHVCRKNIKQAVMTYFYGASERTVSGLLSQTEPGALEESGLEVSGLVSSFQSIMKNTFKPEIDIQNWFLDCSKRIMSSRIASQNSTGAALVWTSPLGLPVVQPYVQTQYMAIRTSLQSFWLPSPYHVQAVDGRKQIASVNANFVHSLDAAHMLLTASMVPQEHSFAAIHDSFWTHGGTVDTMGSILRQAFIQIHDANVLDDLRKELTARYGHFMALATVYSDSPLYEKLIWQRSGITGGARQEKVLEEELVLHYEDHESIKYQKEFAARNVQWRDSRPFLGTPNLPSIKMWVPLQFPPAPPRGSLDLTEVQNSAYFFS